MQLIDFKLFWVHMIWSNHANGYGRFAFLPKV